MSCCKVTSPLEHRDSSTEASEHRDSSTEASELLITERSFLVHVGSMWVRVGSNSVLLLLTKEAIVDAEILGEREEHVRKA